MELGLSLEAIAQLQKEKTEKVTADSERKSAFCGICSRSVRGMFNMLLLCCRVLIQCVGAIPSVQRADEGLGGQARGSSCGDKTHAGLHQL